MKQLFVRQVAGAGPRQRSEARLAHPRRLHSRRREQWDSWIERLESLDRHALSEFARPPVSLRTAHAVPVVC